MSTSLSGQMPLNFAQPIFEILRIPPGRELRVTIESRTAFIWLTHWTGADYLCPGEGCPLCDTQRARAKGWTLVSNQTGSCTKLLELSETVLRALTAATNVLLERGTHLQLSRPKSRKPLRIEILDEPPKPHTAWEHPTLVICQVARLYKLPWPWKEEPADSWLNRVRPTLEARATKAVVDMQATPI